MRRHEFLVALLAAENFIAEYEICCGGTYLYAHNVTTIDPLTMSVS